jgi:hypothetical protein
MRKEGREKRLLKNLGFDGEIIFKRILKRNGLKVWEVLLYFPAESSECCNELRNFTH